MALTTAQIDRLKRKATALADAWKRRYGVTPAKHTVILALCPPSAETKLGDSWPGPDGVVGTQDDENNWGATTFRQLNAAEAAAVKAAGIAPTVGPGHVEAAKQAMAAIAAAGLPVASGELRGVKVPKATIHCDSKTVLINGAKVQQPYFVWFANFEDESHGAEYYLTFVADPGNPARAVLDNPKSGVANLAAAMYARGYFWGFKPHGVFMTPGVDGIMGTADDEKHDGNAENIAAYAQWLSPHFANISAALASWTPSDAPAPGKETDTEPAPPPPLDLNSALDVQKALNLVGCGRTEKGLLPEDGNFGDLSKAALGYFEGPAQAVQDGPLIPITGKFPLRPLTRAALIRRLAEFGHEAS